MGAKLAKELINLINSIVDKEEFVFLLFTKGKVYWLFRHYTKLNSLDAPKILLGKGKPPEGHSELRVSRRRLEDRVMYLYRHIDRYEQNVKKNDRGTKKARIKKRV